MQFKNPKTITKLLLLVGLVSFFFPFVMVSCSSEHVEASGFELMTTISTHEEIEFDSDEDTPNLYLAVAFVCGLLALGAIWDFQSEVFWPLAFSPLWECYSFHCSASCFGNIMR